MDSRARLPEVACLAGSESSPGLYAARTQGLIALIFAPLGGCVTSQVRLASRGMSFSVRRGYGTAVRGASALAVA
jgi:hypothetical protein